MKLPIMILIAALGSVCLAEPNAAPDKLEPGKEVRLGSIAGEILVYVPTDYNETCNWPVVFYYHGQGQTLSTDWLQTATGRKGFVIVSIEFAPVPSERMTATQYRIYVEQEMKNIGAVRHMLQGKLKIDPKMTILAGVSKGGWLVSSIIDYRPQIGAGALIACAGVRNGILQKTFPLTNRYIFIGAGETDQNLNAAKKASTYFQGRGANVVFEAWKGLGHEINPNSQVMQKWFSDFRNNLNRPASKTPPAGEATK
ncbi:MAG: hypothetical protein LLF92_06205 [Planctomycetaceae bacterium]|nr:hypothetical protein [Planctomycetaceae bacterium]